MVQRLAPEEGQEPEEARRALDDALGIGDWRNPSGRGRPGPEREEGAPLWWYGDEEASSGFLKSMGVVLDA